jgi:hypothetical protein
VRTRVKVARPVFRAVAGFRRPGERFFHRFDHQTGVDHLFAGHGLGGLKQL